MSGGPAAPPGDTKFLTRTPAVAVPKGACDCHIHVFGPARRYPFADARSYTPLDATPDDAARMLRTLGLSRVVLVQPSPYGADNRRLLNAIAELKTAVRGIVALDGTTAAADLVAMAEAGVRGVRVNQASSPTMGGAEAIRRVREIAVRAAEVDWHVELHVRADVLPGLAGILETLPVAVVLDHMGNLPVASAAADPGLEALLWMLDTGRCWVKLSGAYRLPGAADDMGRAGRLVRTLVAHNPERLIWGSDWPHTPPHDGPGARSLAPRSFRAIDTGTLLDLLAEWVPDETPRLRILVDNPAALYHVTRPGDGT